MNFVLSLLLLPVVDLFLLVWIGRQTSGTWVLALVVAGFAVGGFLLRHVAGNSLRGFQAGLAAGQAPGPLLSRTATAAIAGVLFILPGVISDFLAVLILIPLSRRLLALWVLPRLGRGVELHGFSTFTGPADDAELSDRVINVRVVDPDDPSPRRLGDSSRD